ncbi:MAG TPA: hypothetical protein VGG14_17590 [Candidatus Sulfotelmatobacter sp.]|jgi:hypothetical protein
MKSQFLVIMCAIFALGVSARSAAGQSSAAPAARQIADDFGAAVKVSTLGVGVEAAARVAQRANVRAGFNVLGYSRTFTKDGIPYDGHLDFRTVEGHFDFFPWAGNFHVSPGLLAYIGDPIKARAVVPGGQSFTLGGTAYYSDTAAPVFGGGKIDFNPVAPLITVGWGNLVPRSQRRFSVPVELGVSFQGAPQATLNLQGSVCTSPGVNCQAIPNDPTVQSNIASEERKLNNSMSVFKAYPYISIGFGVKF